MSKHQEARAKGKVKMLAAFCTEWSSQHEDWGWTFDPKICYWLKQLKPSIQHRGVWRHLPKHLQPTSTPKAAFGHCPGEQSSATGYYLINNINVMIGDDMVLTVGSFSFFNGLLGFPISSTNNLHVHGVEMQQKRLERAGHWVQRQLKKAEHAFTTGICCRLMCCKLKQIFLNSLKDFSSQRFYKSISTGPSL